MAVKLTQNTKISLEKLLTSAKHILFILSKNIEEKHIFSEVLQTKLKRINGEYKDLTKTPLTTDLTDGNVVSFVALSDELNMFQRHTLLLKAIKPLLDAGAVKEAARTRKP